MSIRPLLLLPFPWVSVHYLLRHVISTPSFSLVQVLTRKVYKASHGTAISLSRSSGGAIACANVRVFVCHCVFFSLLLLHLCNWILFAAGCCHWHQGAGFTLISASGSCVYGCVFARATKLSLPLARSNSFKTHARAREKDGWMVKQAGGQTDPRIEMRGHIQTSDNFR